MAKMLRIESCWTCDDMHDGELPCFDHPQRKKGFEEMMNGNTDIPDWCPLPDAPEKGEGE